MITLESALLLLAFVDVVAVSALVVFTEHTDYDSKGQGQEHHSEGKGVLG